MKLPQTLAVTKPGLCGYVSYNTVCMKDSSLDALMLFFFLKKWINTNGQ